MINKMKRLLEEISYLEKYKNQSAYSDDVHNLLWDKSIYLKENEDLESLAENPETPQEKLDEIYKNIFSNRDNIDYRNFNTVLSNLAKNPNTSIDTLGKVFNYDPKYENNVLDNPAIDLFQLENPNFIKEFLEKYSNSGYPIKSRFPHKYYHPHIINYLARYGVTDNIREAALSHPALNTEILKNLYNDPNTTDFQKELIVKNENFPLPKQIPKSFRERIGLAHRKDITQDLLKQLHNDDDHVIQQVALSNVNTTPDALDAASKHPHAGIKQVVVSHPNTSKKTLIQLSKNKNSDIARQALNRLK